jgi:hypothetical protein
MEASNSQFVDMGKNQGERTTYSWDAKESIIKRHNLEVSKGHILLSFLSSHFINLHATWLRRSSYKNLREKDRINYVQKYLTTQVKSEWFKDEGATLTKRTTKTTQVEIAKK